MSNRNIKFQYFVVYRQRKEGNRWIGIEKFDIEQWISIVEREELVTKAIEMEGTKGRIEAFSYHDKEEAWTFQFMKLREDNVPSIAKENEKAAKIPLQPDEYLGEDLYMLYDNNNKIAMVQINRFSFGVKRLEEFFTTVWNKENERIRFKAVTEKYGWSPNQRRKCKSIEVSFANVQNSLDSYSDNSLGKIMNCFNKLDGVTGKIRISLGRSRRETLNIDEVNELVDEALRDESVNGLKLKVKDDDDRPVNEIDLFDDVCSDILSFTGDKNNWNYVYAVSRMLARYIERKEKLVRLTSPEG